MAQASQAFGIDVEGLRPAPDDALALEVLTPREHAEYLAIPRIRRGSRFLHYLTRKEAYLKKATGAGLIDDLSAVDTSQAEVRMVDVPTGFFCRELPVGRGGGGICLSRPADDRPLIHGSGLAVAGMALLRAGCWDWLAGSAPANTVFA